MVVVFIGDRGRALLRCELRDAGLQGSMGGVARRWISLKLRPRSKKVQVRPGRGERTSLLAFAPAASRADVNVMLTPEAALVAKVPSSTPSL